MSQNRRVIGWHRVAADVCPEASRAPTFALLGMANRVTSTLGSGAVP